MEKCTAMAPLGLRREGRGRDHKGEDKDKRTYIMCTGQDGNIEREKKEGHGRK